MSTSSVLDRHDTDCISDFRGAELLDCLANINTMGRIESDKSSVGPVSCVYILHYIRAIVMTPLRPPLES